MRYELMGPLRVLDKNHTTSLNAPKVGTLLAVLVIRADHVVPANQLLSELWVEGAPRRADAALHVYVSKLRKFLRREGDRDSRILTRQPGYMLRLGEDDTDIHRFRYLVERGRTELHEGQAREACATFDSALALWRGPALADLAGAPAVDRFAACVEEARLECLELYVEANFALGLHARMIGPLYQLSADYPLREAFHRQLMLALYLSERQAEALDAYRTVRHILNTELGLEPGRSLRELQREILGAESAGTPRPLSEAARRLTG